MLFCASSLSSDVVALVPYSCGRWSCCAFEGGSVWCGRSMPAITNRPWFARFPFNSFQRLRLVAPSSEKWTLQGVCRWQDKCEFILPGNPFHLSFLSHGVSRYWIWTRRVMKHSFDEEQMFADESCTLLRCNWGNGPPMEDPKNYVTYSLRLFV